MVRLVMILSRFPRSPRRSAGSDTRGRALPTVGEVIYSVLPTVGEVIYSVLRRADVCGGTSCRSIGFRRRPRHRICCGPDSGAAADRLRGQGVAARGDGSVGGGAAGGLPAGGGG